MATLDIIIPCLNEENYIGETLNAIIKEFANAPVVKVIVVDNGSTDKTADVVLALQKQTELNIELVRCPKRGVSRARNCGIAAGSSSFLLFLDADNIVTTDFAKELFHKIGQEKFGFAHVAVECVGRGFAGYLIFRVLDLIKRFVRRPFGKFIVSRELLNKSGFFDERIECGENVEIGMRLYQAAKANGLSYQRVNTPIRTGTRRFKQDGYLKTLLVWFLAYLGYFKQRYSKIGSG